MSTPHVAGVVALVRSLHPDATPEEIRALLRATARDLGAPGHDRLFGAGIVDALAAVTRRAPRVRGVLSPSPDPARSSTRDRGRGRGARQRRRRRVRELRAGLRPRPRPGELAGDPARRRPAPLTDGLLASWNVDALSVGAYVLRLERDEPLAARSCRSSCRSRSSATGPTRSRPGDAAAFAPDVSGELVVWEVSSGRPRPGRDVFARDLRGGAEIPVSARAGRPALPARLEAAHRVSSIAGAWPAARSPPASLDARAERCDVLYVATGAAQRSAPSSSGDRHPLDRGATERHEHAALRSAPRRQLVHTEARRRAPGASLRSRRSTARGSSGASCCRARRCGPACSSPSSRRCPAQLVNDEPAAPVHAGRLGPALRLRSLRRLPGPRPRPPGPGMPPRPARAARVPPRRVGAPSLGDARARRLGRHRRVERSRRGRGPVDLLLRARRAHGELPDAASHPVRLRASREPAIDGRRVVFEDTRDGISRIYGFDLPDLRAARRSQPARGRARCASRSRSTVRLASRCASTRELPGGAAGGERRHAAAATSRTAARCSAGVPHPARRAPTPCLFRGTTPGRLVTRETLQIVVKRAHPHPDPHPH